MPPSATRQNVRVVMLPLLMELLSCQATLPGPRAIDDAVIGSGEVATRRVRTKPLEIR